MTRKLEELDQNELARLLLDMVQRMILHHGLWYTEVRHQVGQEKALELLIKQVERNFSLQLGRLSRVFGFSLTDGLPDFLRRLPAEAMNQLLEHLMGLLQMTETSLSSMSSFQIQIHDTPKNG